MRRMWLWVLIYAFGVGFMLFFLAFGTGWQLDMHPPSGIAYDIGQIAMWVGFWTPMGGFLVCLAGMVLLLIRRTVAAGRVVSLIGLGCYYVAALAVVITIVMGMLPPNEFSPGRLVSYIAFIAVPVGLPAFFMTRTLLRAIKAERGET
jgi:hypothetical protein